MVLSFSMLHESTVSVNESFGVITTPKVALSDSSGNRSGLPNLK